MDSVHQLVLIVLLTVIKEVLISLDLKILQKEQKQLVSNIKLQKEYNLQILNSN